MDDKFLKPYNPKETEDNIYKLWEESGFFNPDNLPGDRTEAYTIVLPPPNVTGVLHLGHAYEDTLQDIAIRFQRMLGKKALWIPGTDSAAISTQARVEKNIQKEESKNRHDLGREELVKRVKEFAKNSETTILSQVRKMGASLDWSRYAYTLDDKRSNAVFTAFKKMYDAGLIYRGNRIVNWDPKGQTTISDEEIIYEARQAKLYTFKYSKDFPIAIATTRLETKVGDTAVAVHPEDDRYAKYVGQTFDIADFCGVPLSIKIVADKSVDKEFGTGALGVTPAHSMIDWDIALRHDLPRIQVINEFAKMTVGDERIMGKKTTDARETIAEWLRQEDLMVEEKDIEQNLSIAERTGGTVEPLPKLQWFVSVDKEFTIPHSEIPGIKSGSKTTLKALMKAAVESGEIDMPQEGFQKTYFHWIENLHDWCISRQIWFGHQIPVWYKENEIYCDVNAPKEEGYEQDPDVLDTWFSSALWTFSTLGWPDNTPDLKNFHPTSFMSPAYEILQLWISRMILMSTFHLGQVPFKKVLIHGLVRAKDGRKFSKSLNNGIDPIDMIEKYGADALRMGLMVGSAIGSDIKFDETKVKGYKNFANKLWNVTRFILTSCEGATFDPAFDYTEIDKKLSLEQCDFVKEVTAEMEEYKFHLVAEKIYHFIWHNLADIIVEESKIIFADGDEKAKASRKNYLLGTLEGILIILHPFMPFVTEEIWQTMKKETLLMVEKWPRV